MKNTFTIKEALSFGWQKTKENWFMFLILGAVSNIISSVPEIYSKIFNITDKEGHILPGVSMTMTVSYVMLSVIFVIFIGTILKYKFTQLVFKMNDGLKVKLSELFKLENGDSKKIVKYFFGSIAFGLLIFFGLMLLIVPGVYFMFTYMFVPYLLVDKDISIKEAFKLSKEATMGNKKQLALMSLASVGIIFLGLLALLVGVIPAMITLTFTSAYIYRKLTK
jgi:uncharacterized membrane protein